MSARMARCHCGTEAPSAKSLFAFEDRSAGSRDAEETCVCGFFRVAHEYEAHRVEPRGLVERGQCNGFVARGPKDDDLFYCGCKGWD